MNPYRRLFQELGPGDISETQLSSIQNSPDIFSYKVSFPYNPQFYRGLFGSEERIKCGVDPNKFSFQISERKYEIEIDLGLSISFKENGRLITSFSQLSKDETTELFSKVKACCQLRTLYLLFKNLHTDEILNIRRKDFLNDVLENTREPRDLTFQFAALKTIPKLEKEDLIGLSPDSVTNDIHIDGKYYEIVYKSKTESKPLAAITYDLRKKVFYKDLTRSINDSHLKIEGKDEGYGFFLPEEKRSELMKRLVNYENKFSRYSKIRERLYTKIIQHLGFQMRGNDQFVYPKEEVERLKNRFVEQIERKMN